MPRSFSFILLMIFVSPANTYGFARQLLAIQILNAEGDILQIEASKSLGQAISGKQDESIDTKLHSWEKSEGRSLGWAKPLGKIELPACPNLVSVDCFILNELRQALSEGDETSYMELMARLHQNNHEALQKEGVALPYSAFLLKNRLYSRSLLVLFPLIKKDDSLRPAYEWIQRLYSHSDRDDGKVAIKNL